VGLFTLQAATEAQTKAFGDDIGAVFTVEMGELMIG
jgi:hypothetical protein